MVPRRAILSPCNLVTLHHPRPGRWWQSDPRPFGRVPLLSSWRSSTTTIVTWLDGACSNTKRRDKRRIAKGGSGKMAGQVTWRRIKGWSRASNRHFVYKLTADKQTNFEHQPPCRMHNSAQWPTRHN
eukprot:2190084-Prymnesium_polylepis.1